MSVPPRRKSSAAPAPAQPDPREQAMADALEQARAARAELLELRRRREEAVKRADAAIGALRNDEHPEPKSSNRVQEALDAIERVTRMPTPGEDE